MNKYIFNIILSFVFAAVVFTACKDDEEDLGTPRLFRPISIEVKQNTEEVVQINWAPSDGAKSYTLQISIDPNFSVINQEISGIPTNTINLTDGVLFSMTENYDFYLRVKADATDGRPDSYYFTATTALEPYRLNVFKTVTKDGVKTIAKQNITKNLVRLGFSDPEVTEIRLEKNGQIITVATLDDTDIANGYKEIEVESATFYYAYIYNGTERKGRVSFTSTPATEQIVDNATDLKALLLSHVEGAYIRVKPGSYTCGQLTITESPSFTLISFNEEKAILDIMLKTQGNVGSIVWEDLVLDSQSQRDGIYDWDGTINGGNAIFRNCDIQNYKKSLVYVRTSAVGSIGNIEIDNCKMDNLCASQGFIDIRAGKSGNISIKNSTFTNFPATGGFVRYETATTGSMNVEIDKCSLYKIMITTATAFFYVRKDGCNVVVKNSIIETVKNGKPNQSVIPSMDYNYYFDVDDNAKTGSNESCTNGEKSGYKDAPNGDFTPVNGANTAASGKKPAGDPRWIK